MSPSPFIHRRAEREPFSAPAERRPRSRLIIGLAAAAIAVVLFVAAPLAWLALEARAARDQERLALAIRQSGGRLILGKELRAIPLWAQPLFGPGSVREIRGAAFDDGGCSPAVLGLLQGAGPIDTLVLHKYQGSLAMLESFPELKHLDLAQSRFRDTDVHYLGALAGLERLDLDSTPITDLALPFLKPLGQLQTLRLNNTAITDKGLEHLAGLSALRFLFLDRTHISDDGLEQLKQLTGLKMLSLEGTRVTPRWVRHLQEALPDTMISYSAGNGRLQASEPSTD